MNKYNPNETVYPDEVYYNKDMYLLDKRNTRIYENLRNNAKLDDEDRTQIERAAKQYKLNPYQRNMMYAIRLAEGTKTFGVQGKIDSTDNTPRDMTDYADITAGSIQKKWGRWKDKNVPFITRFGKGDMSSGKPVDAWCPTEGKLTDKEKELNRFWEPNVRFFMEELRPSDATILRGQNETKTI